MNLKYCYKFLITDVLLNAWEENRIDISCVGKIMERVVYKHVYNYLHQNRIIYEYQSGFLPRHSTVHQLLEIYNSILNSLENKDGNEESPFLNTAII
jgi:hypothetical protein